MCHLFRARNCPLYERVSSESDASRRMPRIETSAPESRAASFGWQPSNRTAKTL